MAEAIYITCALTSLLCAGLLVRGYLRSRSRFLLWSSACFVLLAINNILLFVDKVIVPEQDLSIFRSSAAFLGLALLVYGLVWDSE